MWRVSTVLSLSGMSSAPPRSSQEVLDRGTAVHDAAMQIARGITPDPSPYQGYIDGVRKFFRDFAPGVFAVEERSVNEAIGLTGRIDLFAALMHQGMLLPYVIDWKTGSKAASHGPQTAGYKRLVASDDELWTATPWATLQRPRRMDFLKRAIVYLPGDGSCAFAPQDDPMDEYLFNSALAILQWRKQHGLLQVEDAAVPDQDADRVMEDGF
jgi:hypothetical protein